MTRPADILIYVLCIVGVALYVIPDVVAWIVGSAPVTVASLPVIGRMWDGQMHSIRQLPRDGIPLVAPREPRLWERIRQRLRTWIG